MNLITSLTSKNHYYGTRYGLMPTHKQLAAIESNDRYYEDTFKRQEGASTACVIKAIENAINNPGCIIRVFSNAQHSASCNYNLACRFLTGDQLRRELFKRMQIRKIVELVNGSVISFHCYGDNARGLKADCAIIDAGKFMSEHNISAIKSMTSSSNGQVISLK